MDLYMSNVVTNKAEFKGITWGPGRAGGVQVGRSVVAAGEVPRCLLNPAIWC